MKPIVKYAILFALAFALLMPVASPDTYFTFPINSDSMVKAN